MRAIELLPWIIAVGGYFAFADYLPLGSQILIMILFALSLDLVLGYAGIVTLGHSAFFGVGAYAAGIYAARVSGEPLSGLLVGAGAAAAVGWASGMVILRTQGLTLLMLTLAVTALLAEAANKASFVTGGADGLQGVEIAPIFGVFRFDLFGRTAYVYCLVVLFLCVAVRAPPGAFAVRPVADRHSRKRRAHARDRLAGAATIADCLYDLCGACRSRRGVAGADNAIRRPDRSRVSSAPAKSSSCWCLAASAGCTAHSSARRCI